MRVQRQEPEGRRLILARWDNMRREELDEEILRHALFEYAGGGAYILDICTQHDPFQSVCELPVLVPGEPRIPLEFQQYQPASATATHEPGFNLHVPLAEGRCATVVISGPRPPASAVDQVIEHLQLAKRSLPT